MPRTAGSAAGLTVNYHLLSEFRSAQSAALDELMSQVLAVLMHKGLVKLELPRFDGRCWACG